MIAKAKVISMSVVRARRRLEYWTEEDAARLRGHCRWMARRFAPDSIVAKGGRPEIRPRSTSGEHQPYRLVGKVIDPWEAVRRANLRGPIEDAIRRVKAAGERIAAERKRMEFGVEKRSRAARAALADFNVLNFPLPSRKAKRRGRRAKVIAFRQLTAKTSPMAAFTGELE
jgi:hypothetical protein